MSPLILTLFYGSLATFALLATIRKPLKRELGIVLFLCWIAANLIFWTVPQYRPAMFPLLDVAFMLTAARAGLLTNSRLPLLLIVLSLLSIAMNAALSLAGGVAVVSSGELYRYELVTNLIFVAQCLITGGWGIGLGWVGRITFLSGDRRTSAELRRMGEE